MIQLYHPSEPVAPAGSTVQHALRIPEARDTRTSGQTPFWGPLATPYGPRGGAPHFTPQAPGATPLGQGVWGCGGAGPPCETVKFFLEQILICTSHRLKIFLDHFSL